MLGEHNGRRPARISSCNATPPSAVPFSAAALLAWDARQGVRGGRPDAARVALVTYDAIVSYSGSRCLSTLLNTVECWIKATEPPSLRRDFVGCRRSYSPCVRVRLGGVGGSVEFVMGVSTLEMGGFARPPPVGLRGAARAGTVGGGGTTGTTVMARRHRDDRWRGSARMCGCRLVLRCILVDLWVMDLDGSFVAEHNFDTRFGTRGICTSAHHLSIWIN